MNKELIIHFNESATEEQIKKVVEHCSSNYKIINNATNLEFFKFVLIQVDREKYRDIEEELSGLPGVECVSPNFELQTC